MGRHYSLLPVLRRGRIEAAMGRPVREPRSAVGNIRPLIPPNVPNSSPFYDPVAEGWVDPPGMVSDPDPTPPEGMARPSMDDIIGKYGSL